MKKTDNRCKGINLNCLNTSTYLYIPLQPTLRGWNLEVIDPSGLSKLLIHLVAQKVPKRFAVQGVQVR